MLWLRHYSSETLSVGIPGHRVPRWRSSPRAAMPRKRRPSPLQGAPFSIHGNIFYRNHRPDSVFALRPFRCGRCPGPSAIGAGCEIEIPLRTALQENPVRAIEHIDPLPARALVGLEHPRRQRTHRHDGAPCACRRGPADGDGVRPKRSRAHQCFRGSRGNPGRPRGSDRRGPAGGRGRSRAAR